MLLEPLPYTVEQVRIKNAPSQMAIIPAHSFVQIVGLDSDGSFRVIQPSGDNFNPSLLLVTLDRMPLDMGLAVFDGLMAVKMSDESSPVAFGDYIGSKENSWEGMKIPNDEYGNNSGTFVVQYYDEIRRVAIVRRLHPTSLLRTYDD